MSGPRLVMLMRHALMAHAETPAEFGEAKLDDSDDPKHSSIADLTNIGRSLAETLERVEEPFAELVILHEKSAAAALTAEKLAEAYSGACRAEGWTHAPAAVPPERLEAEVVSPYVSDASAWLEWCVAKVDSVADPDRDASVLLIGHDPGMSWLLARMLGFSSGWRRKLDRFAVPVPALAHTEMVGCELRPPSRWHRWLPIFARRERRLARWSLAPSDSKTEEKLLDKVTSKMATAKVFAGVLIAVTTFAANNVRDLEGSDLAAGLLGLGLLGFAIVLYLMTMFFYDGLLLPKRFWSARAPTGKSTLAKRSNRLARPPSSSTWVIYQNMLIIWSRVFVPATYIAGAGLVSFIYGVVGIHSDERAWFGAGLLIATTLAVVIGRLGRPQLGGQD